MSRTRKVYTTENFNRIRAEASAPVEDTLQEFDRVNSLPSGKGLMQDSVPENEPAYNTGDGEKVIKNTSGNSYIVFGQDRPSTLISGYGGLGAQNSNTIDLVVGRMSSANRGTGPRDGTIIDNNFVADAARIYISQMTDVDTNFGIRTSNHLPELIGKSAIAVKADGVRLIGREGVRITTGRTYSSTYGPDGETNSAGGRVGRAPAIVLNAGNQEASALQGVARGEYVADAIAELKNIVSLLQGGLMKSHALLAVAFSIIGGAIPVPGDPMDLTADQMLDVLSDTLFELQIMSNLWQVNYTNPNGNKYVVSKNVFST